MFIKSFPRLLLTRMRLCLPGLMAITMLNGLGAAAQDSAAIAGHEAKLASGNPDSTRLEAMYQLFVAWRNYDSAKAMTFANDAIALSKQTGNTKKQALVLLEKGKFLNINGENTAAAALMQEAMVLVKKDKNLAQQGHILRALGVIEYDKNNFKEALNYFLQATPLFEAGKDDKGLAGNYIWIGNVFNEGLHQTQDAIAYFQRSLRIAQRIPDTPLISYNLNNIGQAFYIDKGYDSALYYYHQSLNLKKLVKEERGMAIAYNNISNVYFDTQRYIEALLYNDSSVAIKRIQGDKKGLATSYLNGANILQAMGKAAEARASYEAAIALGREIGFVEAVYESYAGLSRHYESQNNPSQALSYFKQYKALYDSVYNTSVTEQMATLEKRFETEKKEKQIQQQQFSLSRKNYLLYGGAGLFALLALLAYSYYRRFKLRKEQQLQQEIIRQQELSTKAVMEAEESERRRIAAELHDGVGQMMSAARMNLSALEAELQDLDIPRKSKLEKIATLVDESCREVRTVSHSMMPNALLKRGLAAAIRDFLDKIDAGIIKVNLHAEGLDTRMDQTVETMVYRIIQEAVNNVIKHSGANHLDISLIREPEGLSISIEDNGRGFDTRQAANFEGIGLKNIISRTQFLKGSVDFDSTPGRGTLVAIHIPFNNQS